MLRLGADVQSHPPGSKTYKNTISETMRKILSGYAIGFNRRHKRRGYLYQNRYKSILCQEDIYLLELIRYIHLNPVRAGIVKDIETLNSYPWTGHSVLIGKNKNQFQRVNEVLKIFGSKRNSAIKRYQEYIKDGWTEGKRDDLIGGGLKRSAGGWEGVLELKKIKDPWRGDERILGDGEFVNRILKKAEELMIKQEKIKQKGWTISRLAQTACELMSITEGDLKKKGRKNNISYARVDS
jgi:hypothetical protein